MLLLSIRDRFFWFPLLRQGTAARTAARRQKSIARREKMYYNRLKGRDTLSDEQIAWHPAFVEAIKAEFEDYEDGLEFKAEHQLTKEPLRIDALIIRLCD
jgi:hypothetical protein